jgi:hypothetical protein
MSEKKYIHGKDAKINKIEIPYKHDWDAVEPVTEGSISIDYELTDEAVDTLADWAISAGGDILDATVIE